MRFDQIALEVWARSNSEALTYSVFFGLFVLMGLAELVLARSPVPALRPRRWSTNAVLTALWVFTGPLIPLSLLGASEIAAARGWGITNWFNIAPHYAFAFGFLARSFISYGTHVATHKLPFLWPIHRVHHLDLHLDVSTTTRFHPLEAFATAPLTIAGVILAGVPPSAVLLYEVFDAGMVVFNHANVRLPRWLDRGLSFVFVTPDMHRVHHSARQPETDSNYGATLSIWDHLFGTHRRKSEAELAELRLGLEEVRDDRAQRILWLLASPFVALGGAIQARNAHGK
jgi:sterol desaturase/sphingolipid hydroxylase (fatty acid hydroxylase superfamily)